MFGPNSMNKALCWRCGDLVDLDTDSIRRKRNLGKRVECVNCRNYRIALERDKLDKQFYAMEDDDPDWFESCYNTLSRSMGYRYRNLGGAYPLRLYR